MRVRVFSQATPAGRAWMYEVINPAAPDGRQLVISGIRESWRSALAEGCSSLQTFARDV